MHVDLDASRVGNVALGDQEGKLRLLDGELTDHRRGLHFATVGNGLCIDAAEGRVFGLVLHWRSAHEWLPVTPFRGRITHAGRQLAWNENTTLEEVTAELGQPFWRHDRNVTHPVTLLFYERPGYVEWQIEFIDNGRLASWVIVTPPMLADECQRQAKDCDLPWPPEVHATHEAAS